MFHLPNAAYDLTNVTLYKGEIIKYKEHMPGQSHSGFANEFQVSAGEGPRLDSPYLTYLTSRARHLLPLHNEDVEVQA